MSIKLTRANTDSHEFTPICHKKKRIYNYIEIKESQNRCITLDPLNEPHKKTCHADLHIILLGIMCSKMIVGEL